ncbi:heme-copper oxidase subunit III [Flaviaesturariibacter aridisoli]|uniref:Heme-copper oxidase subunit III n=2 Tax=Flaviaesturariibacter aridisoli TaxID=2545761 RepID=A0A4R4E5D7_9BACT|nr:heme-copper oxidase subunit III [Flaviaesturariibacter aridisoli]
MMFAGLTSAYIVKSNQANWVEVQMPKAFWGSTAAILLSSLTMHLALRAFRARAFGRYRSLLVATLVLGAAFVVLQWVGFQWLWNHGVQFNGAGAGQFLYAIAGLHAVHVIGGIVALAVVFGRAFFGRTKSYNVVPVEVMATYWHFVDILWLYLLVFFVWIG